MNLGSERAILQLLMGGAAIGAADPGQGANHSTPSIAAPAPAAGLMASLKSQVGAFLLAAANAPPPQPMDIEIIEETREGAEERDDDDDDDGALDGGASNASSSDIDIITFSSTSSDAGDDGGEAGDNGSSGADAAPAAEHSARNPSSRVVDLTAVTGRGGVRRALERRVAASGAANSDDADGEQVEGGHEQQQQEIESIQINVVAGVLEETGGQIRRPGDVLLPTPRELARQRGRAKTQAARMAHLLNALMNTE